MRANAQETANLITFAEKIVNRKLDFLCNVKTKPNSLFVNKTSTKYQSIYFLFMQRY